MIHWTSKTIADEQLNLASRDETYTLGPDLLVRRCEVVLRVPARALTITRTRFVECKIEARKKLQHCRWGGALLEKCRFAGTFRGNQFGRRPDDPDVGGGLDNGDFSATILDGCSFFGCDPETIGFPVWPCFTFLYPTQRKEELSRVRWPGNAAELIEDFVEYADPIVAVTFYAPAVLKTVAVDADELRATLAALPGVKL